MTGSHRRRPATAHDVANLAGVSQSAVSRAFTPGASVSASTREKVRAAADELGYRPNFLARSLINQRSKIVGVISGYMEHPFFARAIERLSVKLSESNLRILLLTAKRNQAADALIDEMLSYQVTAVLLIGVSVSSTLAADCERAGIPVILFNRTAAVTTSAIEVLGDNEAGAIAIAQRFFETGRQRIAFMAGYAESSTSLVREAAFMSFFSERGLPVPRRVNGDYTHCGGVTATLQLFSDPFDRPDAIFCANDFMAIAAIETLRLRLGIEPGEACAVAGFDNIPMAAWPSYSLTTFSQPMDGMVDEAVRIILAPPGRPAVRRVSVRGELILRNTA